MNRGRPSFRRNASSKLFEVKIEESSGASHLRHLGRQTSLGVRGVEAFQEASSGKYGLRDPGEQTTITSDVEDICR